VDGNQAKIKSDKKDLVEFLNTLMDETRELQYTKFKNDIKAGLEAQQEFDRLRNQEKDLNLEIKKLNDDFKFAQDEYAKEALENNKEILTLKKQVNETKTEADLHVQYKDRQTDGWEAQDLRIFDKIENVLKQKIKALEN
jgi:hypothetical protein